MTKFDNFISLFQKKTTESSIRSDYDLEHAVFQGKVCAFTGHRPEKMPFDGEKDPSCLKLMGEIHRQIALAVSRGYRNFISGMALGVDQWAAVAVLDLKRSYPDIALYAALPSLSQPARWMNWQKERYHDLLSQCSHVYVASEKYTRSSPNIRNSFMVKHADLLIAVYDGDASGGTQNTIEMALRKGIETIVLHPGKKEKG